MLHILERTATAHCSYGRVPESVQYVLLVVAELAFVKPPAHGFAMLVIERVVACPSHHRILMAEPCLALAKYGGEAVAL